MRKITLISGLVVSSLNLATVMVKKMLEAISHKTVSKLPSNTKWKAFLILGDGSNTYISRRKSLRWTP